MTMIATATHKECTGCEEEKDLDEFPPHPRGKFGKHSRCKVCRRLESKKWKAANKERAKATQDRWEERNREKRRAQWRHWEETHRKQRIENARAHEARYPEKARARQTVTCAVYEGRLIKPTQCEVCEQITPSRLLHGHHEDYSKPLDIEWLCHKCHRARHADDS